MLPLVCFRDIVSTFHPNELHHTFTFRCSTVVYCSYRPVSVLFCFDPSLKNFGHNVYIKGVRLVSQPLQGTFLSLLTVLLPLVQSCIRYLSETSDTVLSLLETPPYSGLSFIDCHEEPPYRLRALARPHG